MKLSILLFFKSKIASDYFYFYEFTCNFYNRLCCIKKICRFHFSRTPFYIRMLKLLFAKKSHILLLTALCTIISSFPVIERSI